MQRSCFTPYIISFFLFTSFLSHSTDISAHFSAAATVGFASSWCIFFYSPAIICIWRMPFLIIMADKRIRSPSSVCVWSGAYVYLKLYICRSVRGECVGCAYLNLSHIDMRVKSGLLFFSLSCSRGQILIGINNNSFYARYYNSTLFNYLQLLKSRS